MGLFDFLRGREKYVYTGEEKDGKKHGYGKAISPNGHTYVGEWKNGKLVE